MIGTSGINNDNGYTVKRGDFITISGTTGEVYLGKVPMTVPSMLEESAQAILDWCQEIKSLDVRANAEAAKNQPAYNKGARGVGLFRTEHMFLGDRLPPPNRDDADRFLPLYVDKEFFERHPFISIHPAVEKMVRTFVKDARAIDPKFEIFICGEHGGDVYTIGRLHEIGLTGVSMSPGKVYRSIIKAAQCQVQNPRKSVK